MAISERTHALLESGLPNDLNARNAIHVPPPPPTTDFGWCKKSRRIVRPVQFNYRPNLSTFSSSIGRTNRPRFTGAADRHSPAGRTFPLSLSLSRTRARALARSNASATPASARSRVRPSVCPALATRLQSAFLLAAKPHKSYVLF